MNDNYTTSLYTVPSVYKNDINTTTILIGLACGLTIALSLIGNTLVVVVIVRFKRLQNATNFILLSLAIADLTVSFLVMIPSMIYDIKNKWIFSRLFCKFYNAFDITCCTASILHLLLVAVDRYVAIFKPLSYRNMVRKCHVFAFVILVWVISLCLSFIPIFLGLNRIDYWSPTYSISSTTTHKIISINSTSFINTTIIEDDSEQCALEANLPYAIISSSLSFYIPLVIMTLVYIQIYIVARRQAHAIAEIDYQTRKHSNLTYNDDTIINTNLNVTTANHHLLKSYSCNTINNNNNVETNQMVKNIKNAKRNRRTKDTKAIKTLGIIMGIFIICWLPFFIMYIYGASCPTCVINKETERLITWVGYVNSFINPIVYAFTNRDFRKAYIAALVSLCNIICPCIRNKNTKKKNGVIFKPVLQQQQQQLKQTNENKIMSQMCLYICCKCNNKNNDINNKEKQIYNHNNVEEFDVNCTNGASNAFPLINNNTKMPITILNDKKKFYSLANNLNYANNDVDDNYKNTKCFNIKKQTNKDKPIMLYRL